MADDTHTVQPVQGDETPATESEEDRLKICEKLRDEYLAGWQRARADFINYQKAETERFANIVAFSIGAFAAESFLTIDSIELALVHAGSESEKKTLELLQSQLQAALTKFGISELPVKIGDQFDPSRHEVAVTMPGDGAPDTICEIIRKGYVMDQGILRPARVTIVAHRETHEDKNNHENNKS
jgi:molecular chaperone GrpE